MTVSTQSHPIRKAPLFTPYVVVWSMFGALSFGVLMVLGLAPDWLDDLRPATAFSDPQSNHGQRAAARIAADIGELKDAVSQVHLELSKMKTDVAMQDAQHKAVANQVSSLEARISRALPAAAVETSAPPVEAAAQPAPAVGGEHVGTDVVNVPVKTLKVINAAPASAGSALETGSVNGQAGQSKTAKTATADQQVAAFDTAVSKTAPQPVGVKLSTGPSLDSLRLSWSMLADKHGDALSNLEARYITSGDNLNPTYDLVAGPVKSKADAARVCKVLTQRGVPCAVGGFDGSTL